MKEEESFKEIMFNWRAANDPKMKIFMDEIIEVCKRHQLSIAHEDRHGAFMIEKFDDENIEWFLYAHRGNETVTCLAIDKKA